jgi:hypothetical protein
VVGEERGREASPYPDWAAKSEVQSMRRILKALLPKKALILLRRVKWSLDDRHNANRSAEDVFSEIYLRKKWVSNRGVSCSGAGSSVTSVTQPYVQTIIDYLRAHGRDKILVDLGCGDMEVGKHFITYCRRYVGVDVVPSLIANHSSAGWSGNVEFRCLDIAKDELPDGDICLLRQVLQHLSNNEILRILPKLQKYGVTFLTEHYPNENPDIVPNKDMVHGFRIRAWVNSGIYLEKPPFNIPVSCLELVLEVPGVGLDTTFDPGVIRTYKLTFP